MEKGKRTLPPSSSSFFHAVSIVEVAATASITVADEVAIDATIVIIPVNAGVGIVDAINAVVGIDDNATRVVEVAVEAAVEIVVDAVVWIDVNAAAMEIKVVDVLYLSFIDARGDEQVDATTASCGVFTTTTPSGIAVFSTGHCISSKN